MVLPETKNGPEPTLEVELRRRETRLSDGRYLIYFDFERPAEQAGATDGDVGTQMESDAR